MAETAIVESSISFSPSSISSAKTNDNRKIQIKYRLTITDSFLMKQKLHEPKFKLKVE